MIHCYAGICDFLTTLCTHEKENIQVFKPTFSLIAKYNKLSSVKKMIIASNSTPITNSFKWSLFKTIWENSNLFPWQTWDTDAPTRPELNNQRGWARPLVYFLIISEPDLSVIVFSYLENCHMEHNMWDSPLENKPRG